MTEDKVNILLVDDRPENLLALETVLGDLGQNLVRAHSGMDALRCILQQDFAAILLDVQMPEMDGFETAHLIRERERSRHTPIIFLTAIGKSEPEVFKGYSVGAVDYVFKPFVPEILRAKVVVFVDLYKMRQQVSEQAAELASANLVLNAVNQELSSFSYSVSHDLRAPLRGIDGFSQALEEDYGATLEDEAKEHLRRIRAAAKRMNEMIDSLLDMARISGGDLITGSVDLSKMAHEIAEQCQQADLERQVDFVIAANMRGGGDGRLLRSVLQNLMDNAWKYTSKRPQARIEFGCTEEEGERVYFVRDDGVGFDMQHAKNMFTAFHRLHAPEDFPGIGIGLATVQRIINRHGGRVWAVGEVDKGATFYFTLGQ